MLHFDTEQLVICLKGSISSRTNTCGEYESVAAAVWQIQNASHTRPSFQRRWSRRKIQINYTSFFKKLLGFSFGNIFLKCTSGSSGALGGRNPLVRLLPWIQKFLLFFFHLHKNTFLLASFPWMLAGKKSGSAREKDKLGIFSDQTQSLQSSWDIILIINFVFCDCKSHF